MQVARGYPSETRPSLLSHRAHEKAISGTQLKFNIRLTSGNHRSAEGRRPRPCVWSQYKCRRKWLPPPPPGGDLECLVTGPPRDHVTARYTCPLTFKNHIMIRFASVKHRKAEGKMAEALRELSRLANDLSEDETSLKVKCLLKVSELCRWYSISDQIEKTGTGAVYHAVQPSSRADDGAN